MPLPLRLLLVPVAALIAGAAPASAAIPIGGAAYRVHDHTTKNRNWHVDARVNGTGRRVKQLVLYAEQCGGYTPIARSLEIGPVGDVSTWGPVDPDEPRTGAYLFEARFVTNRRLEGSFRIATEDGCDTGPIDFVARTKTRAHAHSGDGQHSHHTSGPAMGTMPDLEDASPRALREAEELWRASLRTATRRFPTIGSAIDQGYVRSPTRWGRPVIYHVRSPAYERDGLTLDPTRPESLVYYWPGEGEPVLVAFMFRAPVGRTPRLASPLLAWHSHTHRDRAGKTQMSHVWLTNGLKSALANCFPVRHLENNLPRFRFRPVATKGAAHESAPCPAR